MLLLKPLLEKRVGLSLAAWQGIYKKIHALAFQSGTALIPVEYYDKPVSQILH
jgi:hypothetical protein